MSGDWYTNSGATFVSIDSMNPKILDFDLDFEKIDFTQQLGRELVVIGTKNDTKKMVLVDTHKNADNTLKSMKMKSSKMSVLMKKIVIFSSKLVIHFYFFIAKVKNWNGLLMEKSWRLATLLPFMKRMMGSGLLIGATLSKIHNKK